MFDRYQPAKFCSLALGVPMAVLREWMLVLDDVTVETYAKGEANFVPGPVTSQLLDFLKGLN